MKRVRSARTSPEPLIRSAAARPSTTLSRTTTSPEPDTVIATRQARVVQRLRVRVDEGSDAGAVCAPDDGGAVSVGTAADNRLALTDGTVSRYHLELRRTSGGVAVNDLDSRNGTWVGGMRIERAVVPPGSRIRLGTTTIVVEDAGSVVAPVEVEPPRPQGLVGDSEAIREVARLVHRLARVDSSVLI